MGRRNAARRGAIAAATVAIAVVAGACGDDGGADRSDATTTTTSSDDTKGGTKGTGGTSKKQADPAASELGTPVEVNIFGTTVTVESAAVFTDGNAGTYLEAELVVDNTASSFEFDPDVALVCATNYYPGRYLDGVSPQSGGTPFPIDAKVPGGAVVRGTVMLTRPVDRSGKIIETCTSRAAVAVLDSSPQETIQLGPELTAELYPDAA